MLRFTSLVPKPAPPAGATTDGPPRSVHTTTTSVQQKQNWGALFAIDVFTRKSAALLSRLNRTPFVAGQVFTAADISCGYAVGLARFLGCEERLDPVVRDYAARLADRPAFRRALSKGQPSTS
jgi:glutathione S-transferase